MSGNDEYDQKLLRVVAFDYQTEDLEQVPPVCPICIEKFDKLQPVVTLPCSHHHTFHLGCIEEWLVRKVICPLCLQRVCP
jgi:hypothetical protein